MWFRGSIAPPARPLSTLRCALAGRQRMTRGQRDWLDLRCRALSSPAPCRFIPTLSPITHHVTDQPHGRSRTEVSPGARAHTHDHQSPRPSATNLTRSHLTPNRWTSKRKRQFHAQDTARAGRNQCARLWAIASARHGRRRVALPVELERPAAAAAAARSARIHQSASQRPNACRRQRTAPRASAQRVAGGACKERVVWLTPGRRPAARASQTRSRPTGGGSPGWSANQGSHEPTPTAFLSVERRATTTPAASHFWISRRTPPIRNPML